jgi:serine/threonine protein kinase
LIDLKPDNIGFTSTGVIKIFDFGLSTCVRTRQQAHEAYAMTGYTGSLRYMAPETAECKPYTEKVDVYSFGILIWQMARDRVPFKDMNKNEFFALVIHGNERPKIDPSWPMGFSSLLTRCWHKDSLQRPSFATVVKELDALIHANHMITLATAAGHNANTSPLASPQKPTQQHPMPPSPIQQNQQQQIQQMQAYAANNQVPVERNRSYTVPYNAMSHGGNHYQSTGGQESVFMYAQQQHLQIPRKVTPPPLQLKHNPKLINRKILLITTSNNSNNKHLQLHHH